MPETIEQFRLTWESVDPQYAAAFDAASAKPWEALTPEEWDALPWQEPTVRIGSSWDVMDQARTLTLWAQYHHQPIRNVVLERREIVLDDFDWQPVAVPGVAAEGGKEARADG